MRARGCRQAIPRPTLRFSAAEIAWGNERQVDALSPVARMSVRLNGYGVAFLDLQR